MERTRRAEMLEQFEANGNLANKLLQTFAVPMERSRGFAALHAGAQVAVGTIRPATTRTGWG